MCARFIDMGATIKIQVENWLIKLFDFRGQTIDVSDQEVFILKDSGIHDEERTKTNVNGTLTAGQKRSGSFCI